MNHFHNKKLVDSIFILIVNILFQFLFDVFTVIRHWTCVPASDKYMGQYQYAHIYASNKWAVDMVSLGVICVMYIIFINW
jgi:hypothetical protein